MKKYILFGLNGNLIGAQILKKVIKYASEQPSLATPGKDCCAGLGAV